MISGSESVKTKVLENAVFSSILAGSQASKRKEQADRYW